MRLKSSATAAVAFVAAAILYAEFQSHPVVQVDGFGIAVDGDSLVVDRVKIRLWGIDAEEWNEPHGQAAKLGLASVIAGRTLSCTVVGHSHDRLVAKCTTEDRLDVGAEVVRRGYALDCERFSGGYYRPLEPIGTRRVLAAKPYCRER